jgi:hypothetical protein
MQLDPERLRKVVIVLCVVGVVAAALASPAAGGSPKKLVHWDSQDVPVSDRSTLFKGDQKGLYEPTIAIDPRDPNNMIAFAIDLSAQNVDPSKYYAATRSYRSTDGGFTWVDKGPVRYSRKGKDVTDGGDPVAVFADDGTAYYNSLATSPNTPEYKWHIWVHRSKNSGVTWEHPNIAVLAKDEPEKDECPTPDKQWLSVDPNTGDLIITYTVFMHECSMPAEFVDLTDIGIFMTRSDDDGRTWDKPRKIWDGYALSAIPEVAPDGTLFVTLWGAVELPPTACPNAIYATAIARGGGRPFTAIVAGASKDGGKTWSWHVEPVCDWMAGDVTKPGRFNGGSTNPSLTVDRQSGTAYVAYPSFEPTGRFTIKMLSSSDGGTSWSAPIEVTPAPTDARMPAVVVDNGILHLVYVETTGVVDHDNSSDQGTTQTFYTASCDGGSTWSEPFPLSTKLGQPTLYTQMGDYIDVDVRDNRIAAIWTDARDGTDEGSIWARSGSIDPSAAAECRAAGRSTQPGVDAATTGSIGVTPFFSLPHRALPAASWPGDTGRSCERGIPNVDLRGALNAGSGAAGLYLPCDVAHALSHAKAVAQRLGYTVIFSEYEGHEAEAFIARDDDLLLVRLTRSGPHRTDLIIDPLGSSPLAVGKAPNGGSVRSP